LNENKSKRHAWARILMFDQHAVSFKHVFLQIFFSDKVFTNHCLCFTILLKRTCIWRD